MNTTPRVTATAVATTLLLSGLSACVGQPAPPPEPVTLSMFHIDGGPELDPAVDWFVEAVSDASDGVITVEVVRGCCEDTVGIEEELIAKVAAGDADLGWVGTRAFEGLGVEDLLPLTAPFLVDGYALQESVIASDVSRAALDGVTDVGVTGLALMPGQMRRPLAVDSPLVSPADWSGVPIASFHSGQNERAFRALGAKPQDVTFEQRDVGIFERTILALENSLTMQDLDREDTLPYATSNVALWPRISALVAAPDSPAVTDAAVREVLQDAAASVAARTADFVGIDEEAMESSCESGARFAEASPSELDALREAVEPIWEDLAEGADTSALFVAIDDARVAAGVERLAIPAGCTGSAPAPETEGGDEPAVVNGRWATPEYTRQELIDAGLSDDDAANAEGRFVLSFEDGEFELQATTPSGDVFGCVGGYSIDGDRLTVEYDAGGDCGPGGTFFSADFLVDGSTLKLSNMDDAVPVDVFLFSSSPLTLVE